MSKDRLKRLQRLEARRPSERPWVDCSPWAIPHLLAVIERRPHSVLPSPERELSPEAEAGIERILRDADRTAERLTKGRSRGMRQDGSRPRAQAERNATRYRARASGVGGRVAANNTAALMGPPPTNRSSGAGIAN